MAGDASRSKLATLRMRDDNPALGVEGPDGGANREKQFLYPSEFLRLMACEGVALRWRRAIALAVYLFPRAGELRALRWEAVDLEHGTIHIHEAFERRSRTVKWTKTKRGRRFAFEPAILPLLEAMHAETGGKGSCALCRTAWPIDCAGGSPVPASRAASCSTRRARRRSRSGSTTSARPGSRGWPCAGTSRSRSCSAPATRTSRRRRSTSARRRWCATGFGDVFPPLSAALLALEPHGGSLRRPTDPAHRAKFPNNFRAGHGIRTRDIQLGKLALYQLS